MNAEYRARASHPDRTRNAWAGWIPLACLPAVAIAVRSLLEPWIFMWILAGGIFLGCKWQSWWECHNIPGVTPSRSVEFLLAWPGMDAAAFLDREKRAPRPEGQEWVWATAKTALGALLLWGVARNVPAGSDLLVGWVGMVGIILILHFGTFHVLSLVWRVAGIDARPIMAAPLCVTSLTDFWGRRWNLGFRQLTHRIIFAPTRNRIGVPGAILLSFFASGVIHDVVISLPARGGYGLPTAYFVCQGLGVLFERSRAGTKLGLSSGIGGWLFAVVCAAGPAAMLFHPLFVHRVILPFLEAVGAR